MHYSELLESVWKQSEALDMCRTAESEKFVRSSIGYPLVVDSKVIGILIISMNRTYSDLTEYEREALQTFTNVVSIVINRVALYEELTLVNQNQESLLHFITHEVKGYLTKSKAMFAAIVEGDFPGTPENLRQLSVAALADVDKGVETVRDILDSSNLKRGTTEYETVAFDFKTAVAVSVDAFQETAKAKGLVLELVINEGEYTYTGDQSKIRRHVIRNLIDNAIKYTPNGTIQVTLNKTPSVIIFSVKDSGVGIDHDDMKKLFTEGGKGKDSVKVNVDSTGYGLFIAKVIVEAHHGKIWVESKGKGEGSTFNVELPLTQ